MWPQNQKNSWNEKGIVWNIHSAFFIIYYHILSENFENMHRIQNIFVDFLLIVW